MATFTDSWHRFVAANPPPSPGPDPAHWPDGMSRDDMERGYGYTVVLFAERWADEMERRLAEGAVLADIADAAATVANDSLGRWGTTGFQYGCAVSALAEGWVHGEALRQWHNLKTQVGTEGERANAKPGAVLNPAILAFGPPSPDPR